jgi:hypothetical protein
LVQWEGEEGDWNDGILENWKSGLLENCNIVKMEDWNDGILEQ